MNKKNLYKSINSNLNSFTFKNSPSFELFLVSELFLVDTKELVDTNSFFEILNGNIQRTILQKTDSSGSLTGLNQYFHNLELVNYSLEFLDSEKYAFTNAVFSKEEKYEITELEAGETYETVGIPTIKYKDYTYYHENKNFKIKNFTEIEEFKNIDSTDDFQVFNPFNKGAISAYNEIQSLNLQNTKQTYTDNKITILYSEESTNQENTEHLGITETATEFYTDENLKIVFDTNNYKIISKNNSLIEGTHNVDILRFGVKGKTIEYVEGDFVGFKLKDENTIQICVNEINEIIEE